MKINNKNKLRADLHMHTRYSDGVLTVKEILNDAIGKGLDIIAITDHDVMDGYYAAKELNPNIRLIPGVELSTEHMNESVHILGYFPNPESLESFQKFLIKQRNDRTTRAIKILDKLKEIFNIDLRRDFINEVSSITRGTIARQIVAQGYNYTHKEIFDKMLGNDCPAYLPSTKLSTKFGIKLIKDSGGIAVCAHPRLLKKVDIYDLISFGVDGLEAIYPSNTSQDEEKFLRIAKENNLIVTAGSDFHSYNDSKHGNLGDHYLEGKYLDVFLDRFESKRIIGE